MINQIMLCLTALATGYAIGCFVTLKITKVERLRGAMEMTKDDYAAGVQKSEELEKHSQSVDGRRPQSDPCPNCTYWNNGKCKCESGIACTNLYSEGKNPENFRQRLCGNCGHHDNKDNSCNGNPSIYYTSSERSAYALPWEKCWEPQT